MIDTSVIRERFTAVERDLNERSRRLLAAAEAKTAGYGGIYRRVACDGDRTQHDWPRVEGPGHPRLVVRRGSTARRRRSNPDRKRPNSPGNPAPTGGTHDDGRSDATT